MTRDDILIKIKETLEKEEVKETDLFKEDYALDSIDLVTLLMDIEEEYGVEVPEEQALEIRSVGDFLDVIYEEVNK